MGKPARLRPALAHPSLPFVLAGLVALLSLPSTRLGFFLDDYVLRAVALGRGAEVGLSGSRFDLFTFFSDAPGAWDRATDLGWAPWWTAAGARVHFFRPLSSLSHWLDFQLFGDAPGPMHLENVAIYAALVIVVALFYRRFLGAGWIAGLAALVYALDPGHAFSTGMICGRNTLLAPLFGVLALLAFDHGQRASARPFVPLSAALLALSLLAGESGLSTAFYLLAHCLCLDHQPSWSRRLRPLALHAVVLAGWAAAYSLLHYGARESGMYTDPGHEPLRYLGETLLRAPIFLQGSIGLPLASLFAALSTLGAIALSIASLLVCVLVGWLLREPLQREPVARFFALGMLLSLLPICAIIPNDRVLFFVGLGGLGLIARLIAITFAGAERASRGRRAFGWFLLVVHVPLAALLYLANEGPALAMLARSSRDPLDAILLEPEVPTQTAVIVNAPAQFMLSHLAVMRVGTSKPIPARWRFLAPGLYPLTVTRLDDRVITVRAEGGLLQHPGTWETPGEPRSPLLNPSYGSQFLNQIMRRADDPMKAGETVALTGVTLTVTEVTSDGRPVEARFAFTEGLESSALRWFQWEGGKLVPFHLPPVGERVMLAKVSAMP